MSKDDKLTKKEKQIVKIFWFKIEHIVLGILGILGTGFYLYILLTETYVKYTLLKAVGNTIWFIIIFIFFIISILCLCWPLSFGRKFWGLDNEKKKK